MKINKYVHDHNKAMEQIDIDKVEKFATIIKNVHDHNGIVYIVGNGGSNCNASHLAEDLCKASKIRAIAIDSAPLITACGNDEGYQNSFYAGLSVLTKVGDLILVISGSGNSENIIHCPNGKTPVLALLGSGGGKVGKTMYRKDNQIIVDSSDMQIIEDVHLAIIHMVVRCLMGEKK